VTGLSRWINFDNDGKRRSILKRDIALSTIFTWTLGHCCPQSDGNSIKRKIVVEIVEKLMGGKMKLMLG
jgi:hypothetical protein